MSTTGWGTALGSAALLSVALAACGSKPPTSPQNAVDVVRLEISGPASIAPGQSAQYSLLRRYSDGSVQPVAGALWSSSKPDLLTLNESGLATAASQTGELMLQGLIPDWASTGPRLATREILVLPDGTFRLVGVVNEAGSGQPVHDARLEARATADVSAPIASFATTNSDGGYRLYGVPGDGFINIRRTGYRSTTVPVRLGAHETKSFDLALEGDRLVLAGAYTMTVEAEANGLPRYCGSPLLRPDLLRRVYHADIVQAGARLTVTLSGAPFAMARGSGNRFKGIATESGADLELLSFGIPYYIAGPEYPDVVEALSDGTVLVPAGKAILTRKGSGLSGTLGVQLTHYSGSNFPSVQYLGTSWCTTVTLTPR
jgi:hypothetical protein